MSDMNMKKIALLLLAMPLMLSAGLQHRWKGVKEDSGKAVRKRNIGGGVVQKEGFFCSKNTPKHDFPSGQVPLNFPEYTIEVKFKLNEPFVRGKSRGLFNYGFWSWSRKEFRFRIDKQGALAVYARCVGEKGQPPVMQFSYATSPLTWEVGKEYAVRVAARKGGELRIWRNGEAVGMVSSGAPGLDEINKSPNKTVEVPHMVRLGWDTTDARLPHGALEGFITDCKIYDSFEFPEATLDAGAEGIRFLTVSRERKNWSSKFDVPDKAGYAYGSKYRADNKFIENASTAAISCDDDFFYATIRNPIPAGMKLTVRGKGVWDGEAIELFIRPDVTKPEFFQYCAGSNGAVRSYHWLRRNVKNEKFQSKAEYKIITSDPAEWVVEIKIPKAEVKCAGIKPGMSVTGNICRTGATCGGQSSWIPVAGDFHNVDAFGKIIIGSLKDYFLQKAAEVNREIAKYPAADAAPVVSMLNNFSKNAEQIKDSAADYLKMDQQLKNLQNELLSLSFAGKKLLLWETDPFVNRFEPGPFSKPMKKISLKLGMNDRAFYGFAVSNLTGKPFLGQIKCFKKWPLSGPQKAFGNEPWSRFLGNIEIRQGVMAFDPGGAAFYDAIAPMPLGSLLKLAANETLPIWLTVSTKGLKPGVYRADMVLKSHYPGFSDNVVKLEVEVLPVDLAEMQVDSFHYSWISEWDITNPDHKMESMYKFFSDQEANVLMAGLLTEVYPKQYPDGTLDEIDFSRLDKKIDAYLRAGVPQDRMKLMFNLHTFIFVHYDKNGKQCSAVLKFGTPEFEKGFTTFMQKFYAHLEQKYGLAPERVIIYTGDEPEGDINDPKSRMYRVNYLGRLVKKAVPRASTATNPYPRQGINDKYFSDMRELCKNHNYMILLPQAQDPRIIKFFKERKMTIWTYLVLNKLVTPETYRKMFYDSYLRGADSANGYWSLDSTAGDNFDSQNFGGNWAGGYSSNRMDYGSLYVDFNVGKFLYSRRAEAHYQGLLDYKLIKLAEKYGASKDTIKAILAKSMNGSCTDMDNMHVELLNLIIKLKNK
ncbi:MAG: hypothetical protein E7058_07750 [Lentisphaerae bacterium]|nr:hypothetical protein [Lentisphaerota bacterium]